MENSRPHHVDHAIQQKEPNHSTLSQSAHTKLSPPLNGSPVPVNGVPGNGVLNSSTSPSDNNKQHDCDMNVNSKGGPVTARKSSLTLSLTRRGSGFVSPVGDTILNRPAALRKKSSEHHVQFEPHSTSTAAPPHTITTPLPVSEHSPVEISSSSSSSSESSLDNLSQMHPPDGGWGWVIVFASFMVNVIADGITFSFGVIFIEFLHYFGEGKSKTAWIGSLFMSIPLLSGPIASFLTDRYGCRKVTILGGILAAIGFILSSFTSSINVLLVTFGIIAGFGLSLCYVAAVVIVAYYFDDHRSFATGLSVCGSGIGTFLFAPLTHYLLKEYGWRGTTLILAGLFLNLCVCGALMRDLAWTKARSKAQRKQFKKTRRRRQRLFSGDEDEFSQHSTVQSAHQHAAYPSIDELKKLLQQPAQSAHQHASYPSIDELKKLLQQPGYMVTRDESSIPRELGATSPLSGNSRDPGARLCSSLVNLPTFVRSGEKVPLEVLEALTHQQHVYSVLVNNYPSLLISSRSFSQSGRLNEQASSGSSFCNCLVPSPICSPRSQSHPTSPLATQSYPPSLPITAPTKENQINSKEIEDHSKDNEDNDRNPDVDEACDTLLPPEDKNSNETSGGFSNYNMLDAKLSPTSANGEIGGDQTARQWLLNKRLNHNHHHHHNQNQDQQPRRLPTAYLKDLRVHRHSLTYRGAMLNINRYRLRASSCPDIYRNSMTTIAKEKADWYAGLCELWYLLSDMLDFSHFKNVKYTLFAISNFLLYFWYDVPYVYLADNAIEAHGITEEDASYLISVIGILNMFGEIALGWAGDREWVNANLVYAVSMALCGAALVLVPLIKSYQNMCGISGFFGLFVAANYSLTSIILVEITTIERFTNAYGLLLLVQGIANLVGPPLAGKK
ncbi:hypothetical protein M8J75_007623 [Diaphorina citri]|nr:hypothetical protein M8J75_007623 [Diaphorina citri]